MIYKGLLGHIHFWWKITSIFTGLKLQVGSVVEQESLAVQGFYLNFMPRQG